MKRNILFCLVCCFVISLQSAQAQGVQEWQEQQLAGQREQQLLRQEGKRPVYCNVMGYNFWGVGKVKVRLDMGDGRFSSLYDEQGKALKFGTMMSVLDYMGVRGWRCVDTYYISDGKSSRVIHYLLEKWVSTDEEKLSGLQLQKAEDEPYERGKNMDDMY